MIETAGKLRDGGDELQRTIARGSKRKGEKEEKEVGTEIEILGAFLSSPFGGYQGKGFNRTLVYVPFRGEQRVPHKLFSLVGQTCQLPGS